MYVSVCVNIFCPNCAQLCGRVIVTCHVKWNFQKFINLRAIIKILHSTKLLELIWLKILSMKVGFLVINLRAVTQAARAWQAQIASVRVEQVFTRVKQKW